MIAAIGVGGLLFARVLDRRRELAVRAALGADSRLAAVLLIEATLIVIAGGLVGAVVGPRVLDAFLALSPVALPAYLELEPRAWTFAVAFAALAASSLLGGVVPVLAGRRVRPGEVSRSLAERMGGLERAIGRHLVFQESTSTMVPSGSFRIVGVASDIAYDGLVETETRRYISLGESSASRPARHDVYVPLARFPVTFVSIAASTSADARALVEPLRRRVAQVVPTSAQHWTGTMVDEVGLEYAPSRFYAILVAAFSFGALTVTSVGLFALLSHAAARRSGEMGVRLALGATPMQTSMLLLRSGLGPLAVGAFAGLVGAAWAGAALRVLYDVAFFDLWAFAGALKVLVAVTLVSGIIPARRVASVDPLSVLRAEPM